MKKFLIPLFLIISFNLAYLVALHSSPSQVVLDQTLREKLLTKASDSVLILMKEKANLAPAYQMRSREERGLFVYNSLRQTALKSQESLVKYLEEKQIPYQRFYIANMIALKSAPFTVIEEISKRDDVEKIYENPDFTVPRPVGNWKTPDDGSAGDGKPQENIERINAAKVWNEFGIKGQGIIVAGQDSGVDWNHPALNRQYRGHDGNHDFNWHDAIREPLRKKENPCGYNTAAPCDDGAHGTHTMGTVIGSDGQGNWIGVAPEAQWMACRNMDDGDGTPATYIECFEFFLAPYARNADPMRDGHPEMAPHVINNSWGCPLSEGCSGREMIPVMEALQAAGIFVVASAGNDGPDCSSIDSQPAHLTNLAFSVGAVQDTDDSIAFFSSRGPSLLTGQVGPDLTAPGVNIRSSVPGKGYEAGWSGTSMAGPHVTGVVALLWSAAPKLIGHVKETMDLLRKTSKPLTSVQACGNVPGSQIPNNTFGYGLIDAYAAVKEARASSSR